MEHKGEGEGEITMQKEKSLCSNLKYVPIQ